MSNDGHARGAAAEIERGDDAAGGRVDGHGERAEADLVLLVDQGVAVAADVAQGEAKLFDAADGAGGVRGQHDAGEILLELLGRQIRQQDAAHAGAVGGQAAADVEIVGHDAGDGGARDVDDVVAVERGDGEALAQGGGHALEDGLGGGGEGVGGGVGVREREHARAQGVAGAVFDAGEAELGEGVEAAADGGAGEAGLDGELRDGHLRGLRGEGLDDEQAAGERGHEVRVAGVDVERGGRRCVRRCGRCGAVSASWSGTAAECRHDGEGCGRECGRQCGELRVSSTRVLNTRQKPASGCGIRASRGLVGFDAR